MEGYYFDHALLISCIDGLGRFSGKSEVYEKEIDTVNCLKDIDRFLRRDFEDTKEALITMGKCNVVSQNLLPLLKSYPSDQDILYHTSVIFLRVLVLMSMPPQDSYPRNVKDIHHTIKAEFTNADALAILMSMCHEPLSHFEDLSDAHYKTLQMFVTFIRNMMLIPDSEDCGNATARHHHSTLQVDFLKTAFQENVLELVGLIAQHMGTKVLKADAPVMLDLLHGIFASFDPRSVLNADESALLNRNKARSATAEDLRKSHPAPTKFSVKAEKPVHDSISHIQTSKPQPRYPPNNPGLRLMSHSGEHAFYVKTVPGTFGQVVLKNAARTKAAAKVQATVNASPGPVPKTTNTVLLASVKVYTSQLLRGAFNAVMTVAREEASLGLNVCSMSGKSMLRFFELAAWFMQYCRYQEEVRAKKFSQSNPGKLQTSASSLYQSTSSILSWKMIYAVLRVWLEMIDTDGKQKKETEWGLQEASIKVLKEALSLLDLAFHYGSQDDKKVADMLQRRLLQNETKEAGVLNRITQCMRQYKKHDKRIVRQEGRESRAYAVDMVKTMHIVLRVYSRLCQQNFSVVRPSNRHSTVQKKKQLAAKEGAIAEDMPSVADLGQGNPLEDPDKPDADGAYAGDNRDLHSAVDTCSKGQASRGKEDDDEDGTAGDPEDLIEDSVSHRRVEFAAVLKTASHIEVLKLYMFLLEKYKALDAATLHAIATFLGRICNELRLEPMLYQISYLKQFHTILSDETLKNKPMYRSLKKTLSRIASHLIARLDPTPVSLPGPSVTRDQAGNTAADDNDYVCGTDLCDDESARMLGSVRDGVLECLPEHSRQSTLLKVQDRVTKLLFVELLFEKGPRESEMIQAEYSWRQALLGRTEGRGDQQHVSDDPDNDKNLPDHPHQEPGRCVDTAGDESDEEDALPQPGAEKQAPHRPSKALAAGLQMTAEEQLRFKALFETVNGSRSARQLLLAEWNQQEELKLTSKQVAHTMAALNLRPGELTQEQEERLAMMVEELGKQGRCKFKRVANAFPGGFSSAAIKKHMTRLKLTLPGGKARRTLEDLEGADQDGADAQVANGGQKRKRGRNDHKPVATSQPDESTTSGSDKDRAAHIAPAAKRQRSSVQASPAGAVKSAMVPGGLLGTNGSHVRGILGLEDDVATQECGATARALVSSEDDWGTEGERVQGRDHVLEDEAVDKPETSDLQLPDVKQRAGATQRKKKGKRKQGGGARPKEVKKLAEKLRNVLEKPSRTTKPYPERHRTSGMRRDAAAIAALDVHAVEKAARLVKDELQKDGDHNVTEEDIMIVVADLLAGSLVETSSQNPDQVQLSIWPETDAEEQIMSMPATEALLDTLGLHFGGGDDPSTWLLDGSVHELQDRLMSLLDAAPAIAYEDAGRLLNIRDIPSGDVFRLQDDEDSMPDMAGLLDNDDDVPDGYHCVKGVASVKRRKMKMALFSDGDHSNDGVAQPGQPATRAAPQDNAAAGMRIMEHQTIDEISEDFATSGYKPTLPADMAAVNHGTACQAHGNVYMETSCISVPAHVDSLPAKDSLITQPVALELSVPSSMHACVADAQAYHDVADVAPIAKVQPCQQDLGGGESPHTASHGENVGLTASGTDDPFAEVHLVQPAAAAQEHKQAGLVSGSIFVEPFAACDTVLQGEVEDITPALGSTGVKADMHGVGTTQAGDLTVSEHSPGLPNTEVRTMKEVQSLHAECELGQVGSAGADLGPACYRLQHGQPVPIDAAGPYCSLDLAASIDLDPGAAADDLSPQLAPTTAVEHTCGDADMMTPVMADPESGLVHSRSATRSVTFSEITTDLASGPTHEWQGDRQRRQHKGEGNPEEGQSGVKRLPRPALKPQCRANGSGLSVSAESPPHELVVQDSVAELPPSFGILQVEEAAILPGGSQDPKGQRVPLSPIKVNPLLGRVEDIPSKELAAVALTAPGSQGRRPRTKKARLEAIQASQESGQSPSVHCAADATGDKLGKTGMTTPIALSTRTGNVPP